MTDVLSFRHAIIRRTIWEHAPVTRVRLVPLDMRLDALAYDSLSLIGLAVALEDRFAVSISDENMAQAATVADVIMAVDLALLATAAEFQEIHRHYEGEAPLWASTSLN